MLRGRTAQKSELRRDRTAVTKVLVALDASLRTAFVFDAAARAMRGSDAVFYPVRAIFAPPRLAALVAGSRGKLDPERLASEDFAWLKNRTPELSIALPVVRHGQPWRVILDAARELDVDLIVLGSRAYQSLDTVPGTTTARVTSHARCNVLVVHEGDGRPRARSLPTSRA